ncbi:NAD(+)/NADH kinase [Winogradskyella psychrotolerans]|uniref:NAD(+)/NADH kinase n=1 Tax=Winogradskyella psychrotolerans TaxID=1344585 RepID=UPI001C079000|nr:NAD(+)/NADH kinase [Winogradskyella psychrotolerans]MBU2929278.1 NAD(+)/NADH kinase [Winogradskyella psychrotolerans]
MKFENVIIIRDKTRLEQLIERFNSKAQAKFYIESSGRDFAFFESEHHTFYESLSKIKTSITDGLKYKVINRSFLPTYMFTAKDIVLVIGQDGLVANTAKYVNGLPIIGINPDPKRYDGILLKHAPNDLKNLLKKMLKGTYDSKQVTMAKATLNDGQELLAFNDFYIGADSHVSSRYSIEYKGIKEQQSSSGIIVSTGAGSTGWLSSIFNMTNNISEYFHNESRCSNKLEWNANQLVFVVREPFLSKQSQTNIGYGIITENTTLKIESNMPTKGIIFSDGIESDFLNFNSGSVVDIGLADEKANLVV